MVFASDIHTVRNENQMWLPFQNGAHVGDKRMQPAVGCHSMQDETTGALFLTVDMRETNSKDS
jgi:hypothetical protein